MNSSRKTIVLVGKFLLVVALFMATLGVADTAKRRITADDQNAFKTTL
jgi:hypothetical protein